MTRILAPTQAAATQLKFGAADFCPNVARAVSFFLHPRPIDRSKPPILTSANVQRRYSKKITFIATGGLALPSRAGLPVPCGSAVIANRKKSIEIRLERTKQEEL
jgi:hypothetical protein